MCSIAFFESILRFETSPMKSLPSSRLQLPPGTHPDLLEGLCASFPQIPRETWIDRFSRDRVQDATGTPLSADAPYRVGMEIRYFREVADEPVIHAVESIVHADAHLVVADKPHGLPVVPAGAYVRETLLHRLVQRLGNPDLVPLHRIDRATAGLVLFSADPQTRGAYQALFRERAIRKVYEAVAPPLPDVAFPLVRATRLEGGEPFFRMREVAGAANSETRVDVAQRDEHAWRYVLEPVTGRKHQLRVHMAALGAPIANDRWYPVCLAQDEALDAPPLQLVARRLEFVDPIDGRMRRFESAMPLQWPPLLA